MFFIGWIFKFRAKYIITKRLLLQFITRNLTTKLLPKYDTRIFKNIIDFDIKIKSLKTALVSHILLLCQLRLKFIDCFLKSYFINERKKINSFPSMSMSIHIQYNIRWIKISNLTTLRV